MTPRERKYHQAQKNKNRIVVRYWATPAVKFSMDDLKDTFCMCIPNYCYDQQGKIIPPKDGSEPQDKFIFGKWIDGKMIYDDESRTA